MRLKIFSSHLFVGLMLLTASMASIAATLELRDTYQNSKLYQLGRLFVLDLHGTRPEMLEAHGYFAKKYAASPSGVDYYSKTISRSLKKALGDLGGKVVNATVAKVLTHKMSEEDTMAYQGLAKGLGRDYSEVKNILIAPDFGEVLMSVYFSKNKTFPGFPEFGCSSFVKNDSSGYLIGRNLEFGGVGSFDRYPAIVYLNPTTPGENRYIQMTSLGLPSSHTAVNEHGIYLALHQLTVSHYGASGDIILLSVDEVLRKAKNLDEALAILAKKKYYAAWKMIISSLKEKRSVVVEVSPKTFSVQKSQAFGIAQSNHSNAAEMKDDEFFNGYNYALSSQFRRETLKKLLNQGMIKDVESGIKAMSLSVSLAKGGKEDYLALSKFSNILSVVLDADKNLIYYGVAKSTFEKPSSGSYVEFPIDFSGKWLNSDLLTIDSSQNRGSAQMVVDKLVREAAFTSETPGKEKEILANLLKAIAADPSEPKLKNMAAVFSMKVALKSSNLRSDLINQASQLVDKALKQAKNDHDVAISSFIKYRLSILSGDVERAQQILTSLKTTTQAMKKTVASNLKLFPVKDQSKLLKKVEKDTLAQAASLTDLDLVKFE